MKVDLDLGNYERFLNLTLTRDNNITTGKIYQASVGIDIFVIFSRAFLKHLVNFDLLNFSDSGF